MAVPNDTSSSEGFVVDFNFSCCWFDIISVALGLDVFFNVKFLVVLRRFTDFESGRWTRGYRYKWVLRVCIFYSRDRW